VGVCLKYRSHLTPLNRTVQCRHAHTVPSIYKAHTHSFGLVGAISSTECALNWTGFNFFRELKIIEPAMQVDFLGERNLLEGDRLGLRTLHYRCFDRPLPLVLRTTYHLLPQGDEDHTARGETD
jgi:hypothetical protein